VTSEVRFEGRPIQLCDGPSFLSAWDEIFVNRIYDLGPSDRELCLVDAGANIGLAPLYWKWHYGRIRYLGFEPDPVVAECCRRNLAAWGIDGELVEAALGAKEGTARFARDGADAGRVLGSAETDGKNMLTVPVKRLSAFLPKQVDLLKIDVEGSEGEVLEEVEPLLSRVRAVFLEWHGAPGARGLAGTLRLLEEAGFECYPQVAVSPKHPFMRSAPPGPFSQQLNLYAFRP